jgi:hypothetical protein
MRNATIINETKTAEKATAEIKHFDKCGELKVGTIMVSSWGYDQTNVDFYVVTRRTKCTADLTPLASDVAPTGTWGVSEVMPDCGHYFDILDNGGDGIIKGKRVKFEADSDSYTQIKIDDSERAYIWDGTAKTQTSYN